MLLIEQSYLQQRRWETSQYHRDYFHYFQSDSLGGNNYLQRMSDWPLVLCTRPCFLSLFPLSVCFHFVLASTGLVIKDESTFEHYHEKAYITLEIPLCFSVLCVFSSNKSQSQCQKQCTLTEHVPRWWPKFPSHAVIAYSWCSGDE